MEDKSEKGGFFRKLFGRKKEPQAQTTGETPQSQAQPEILTPEQASERAKENIARGGAKDFTAEVEGSTHTGEPSRQVSEPIGTQSPTGEALKQKQTQTALNQSLKQGQQIREQAMGERIRQATTVPPKPENPVQKISRMEAGKVREE